MLEQSGEQTSSHGIGNMCHWLSARFPEGLTGEGNAIPVTIDGNEMEIVIFKPESGSVSFGLLLPGHVYPRKTLVIGEQGLVAEDKSFLVPDFDKADDEPVFTSSDEEIAAAVMKKIREVFPDH
jgi:hypothetical protein